jgi:polyhydroxyalkanoate synthesis regulator phasin
MMKTTIEKALMLGLGLAAEGKEQIEKTVEELVEKGEVGRNEARSMVEKLIHRGENSRQQLEQLVQRRVQAALLDQKLVTEDRVAQLELRIQKLEHKADSVQGDSV